MQLQIIASFVFISILQNFREQFEKILDIENRRRSQIPLREEIATVFHHVMDGEVHLSDIMTLIIFHQSLTQMVDSRVFLVKTLILLIRVEQDTSEPMTFIVLIFRVNPRILPSHQERRIHLGQRLIKHRIKHTQAPMTAGITPTSGSRHSALLRR